jgi:hypothetical protein
MIPDLVAETPLMDWNHIGSFLDGQPGPRIERKESIYVVSEHQQDRSYTHAIPDRTPDIPILHKANGNSCSIILPELNPNKNGHENTKHDKQDDHTAVVPEILGSPPLQR